MAGKSPGSSLASTPAYSGLRWRCSPATTPSCHFRCGALSTAPMTNWTFSFIRPSRIPRPVENLTPSERNHLHQTASRTAPHRAAQSKAYPGGSQHGFLPEFDVERALLSPFWRSLPQLARLLFSTARGKHEISPQSSCYHASADRPSPHSTDRTGGGRWVYRHRWFNRPTLRPLR